MACVAATQPCRRGKSCPALSVFYLSSNESESVPLAGAPVGSDATLQLDHPLRQRGGSQAVAKALVYATELFRTYHAEDPHWTSSKNASDQCWSACYSPGGCPSRNCVKMGPPGPPPIPPAPAGAPIAVSALLGNWSMNGKTFTVSVDTSEPSCRRGDNRQSRRPLHMLELVRLRWVGSPNEHHHGHDLHGLQSQRYRVRARENNPEGS